MIREPHVLLPELDFQASRKSHPELPGPSTWRPTAVSFMKNEFEMESPKSADMDPDIARLFQKDHQTHFEKEILSVIECKNPETESIESRWHSLQRKVIISADGWKDEPKMLPHLQQCAADLFARMYYREFTDNPKNKKYSKKGSKAILAQMKTELNRLKVWSCVYKGLEWRVYDKFGDPEEVSTSPTGSSPVDMELLKKTIGYLNDPWKHLSTTVTSQGGSHSTPDEVHPPLPNINHSLPILPHTASPVIIPQDRPPPYFGRYEGTEIHPPQGERKPTIKLKVKIPQRQPLVIQTEQISTENIQLYVPVHPPILEQFVELLVDKSATIPDYFIDFYNQRCVKVASDYRMQSTDFYKAYDDWRRVGDKAPKIAKRKIGEYLKNLNIRIQESNSKTYYYIQVKGRR